MFEYSGLIFFVLQLASELFENKINSKIFKANSLYKQSSRLAHFPELA